MSCNNFEGLGRCNRFLVLAVLMSSIGMFTSSYDNGVLNNLSPEVTSFINETILILIRLVIFLDLI